ncbi:MAG: Asp23/Gls24 family envelope stress response protein [Firmicutes bacterium]|nr:Asp23/Gls24 family envelope stress response protein [Bacillota bacterium]HOB35522.1 Asp23/Gls24 family envelope stress response protein [Bacillota bacterium]HPZ90234.1 Asp23/Gls24 family envelope stress response protein [Bacillota bacterium]HQE01624.1 Asp23/Gls24 family envelope stress response protein [Bacillota bacterium]
MFGITGKLVVNDDVFVDIAMAALQKVEDVIRQQRKGAFAGLGRLLSGKMGTKVFVQKNDGENGDPGSVSFDLRLVMVYGVVIPEVAEKVREAVIKDVSAITGYHVDRVDITVERLVHPDEVEKDA